MDLAITKETNAKPRALKPFEPKTGLKTAAKSKAASFQQKAKQMNNGAKSTKTMSFNFQGAKA